MPSWLTREKVYLAWLAVTSLGAVAFVFAKLALPAVALLFLAVYGAVGLDGLAHYTLALCSEHTLLANITIWAEAVTGVVLLLASAVLFARQFTPRPAQIGDESVVRHGLTRRCIRPATGGFTAFRRRMNSNVRRRVA